MYFKFNEQYKCVGSVVSIFQTIKFLPRKELHYSYLKVKLLFFYQKLFYNLYNLININLCSMSSQNNNFLIFSTLLILNKLFYETMFYLV